MEAFAPKFDMPKFDMPMWQNGEKFVRPDDKVLRDSAGGSYPVRNIASIEVDGTDGNANVIACLVDGRKVCLMAYRENAKNRAAEVRDRIIREIYDSPKRIVCAHEDDPMNEGGEA